MGGLTVIYGSQCDGDGALVSAHLALVAQQKGQRTLLLDLGLPRGDSLAMLSLESTFNFGDALRHLRRLDSTLIDSAFTLHPTQLRILAYAEDDTSLEHTSAAELYMLLSALRQHFQHVVVNLVGQPDSESLRTFVAHCDQLLWYVDQNVIECRRNLAILNLWREKGLKLQHAGLLVDKYLRQVTPNAETLEKTFGLKAMAVLPLSPELRLNAKNQGLSLFELSSRESLTAGLRHLGERLASHSEDSSKSAGGWLTRLWGRR
jgi:pilus assembly protein CpaE